MIRRVLRCLASAQTLTMMLLVPGCVLKIGTSGEPDGAGGAGGVGGASQEPSDPSGGSGGSGNGVDDQAAIEATLDQADDIELAKAQLRAETAAYLFQGLVEENVDPAILDTGDAQMVEDTVQALADVYGADVWAQAGAWVDSLDPKALVPSFPVYKQSKCVSTYGCPDDVTCNFDFGTGPKPIQCVVTGCGSGKCTWCPDIFPDLSNLIVKSWCSFTCVKDYQSIVGIAGRLNLAFNGKLDGCYKFDKPIPCEGGTECYPNKP